MANATGLCHHVDAPSLHGCADNPHYVKFWRDSTGFGFGSSGINSSGLQPDTSHIRGIALQPSQSFLDVLWFTRHGQVPVHILQSRREAIQAVLEFFQYRT